MPTAWAQLEETARELGALLTDRQRRDFLHKFSEYATVLPAARPEFPSARRVLRVLQKRYDVVVSGMPESELMEDPVRRGLAQYVTYAQGGDKGVVLDHRAEGRQIALLVGDAPHDVAIAASRGIPFYPAGRDEALARLPPLLL